MPRGGDEEKCPAPGIVAFQHFLTNQWINWFFVGRQKIFTRRLVCGEFRQVHDKIGACRAISDSARSQNVLSGLVGQCAVDQDNLSGLARTSSNCHETHVNKRLFQHCGYRLGPRPNRGKGLITWAGLARLAGLFRCAEMTFSDGHRWNWLVHYSVL